MSVELTPNGTHGAQIPRIAMSMMNVMSRLFSGLIRMRGGRILTLTTIGSKTGRSRDVDLGWFPDDNKNWLIVASFGGAAKHPAWYYNLARNPDKVWIHVDGRKIKVRPESLKGDERAKAFNAIAAVATNYAEYQTKTDREIPVVRLTAETE
jgi:deazaflavin-dependent oxidoreductase (nitroreductase family)